MRQAPLKWNISATDRCTARVAAEYDCIIVGGGLGGVYVGGEVVGRPECVGPVAGGRVQPWLIAGLLEDRDASRIPSGPTQSQI